METNTINRDFACITNDGEFFVISDESGFHLFSTAKKFTRVFSRLFLSTGISKVYCLESSNLFVLIADGNNSKYPLSKLFLWDDLHLKTVMEIELKFPIRDIKMTLSHLFVVTLNELYVIDLETKQITKRWCDNISNKLFRAGAIDVTCNKKHDYCLALPSLFRNDILIHNFTKDSNSRGLEYDSSKYQGLKFNKQGKWIAVVSLDGCKTRVFSIKRKGLFQEFKTGRKKKIKINSIAFSYDNKILAVIYRNGILQLFKIKGNPNNNDLANTEKPIRCFLKMEFKKDKSVLDFNKNGDLIIVFLSGIVNKISIDVENKEAHIIQKFNYHESIQSQQDQNNNESTQSTVDNTNKKDNKNEDGNKDEIVDEDNSEKKNEDEDQEEENSDYELELTKNDKENVQKSKPKIKKKKKKKKKGKGEKRKKENDNED
ncbi:wd-repeat protein interacting with phosphoinosides wipi -related [Anaeramoeba flamelloides]|uniref:Wd-repeat protein interacting with phosphoinosides wipi -related n=1 Tax=Anaeramoeba flamelloides TaxID=1746091 RepID=A0AAV8AE98_9EUKA|nr:wd-repeat protein interacting with phosphoinosides wipi -related [Anaeramoeba flamelloides]